jgi:hypothetical protein
MKQDNEIMRIKVMADFECWPLWWHPDYDIGNVDPETLGLSPALCNDLTQWAAKFDAIVDRDDPTSPAFATVADEEEFHQQGRVLTARLQGELAKVAIVRYRNED